MDGPSEIPENARLGNAPQGDSEGGLHQGIKNTTSAKFHPLGLFDITGCEIPPFIPTRNGWKQMRCCRYRCSLSCKYWWGMKHAKAANKDLVNREKPNWFLVLRSDEAISSKEVRKRRKAFISRLERWLNTHLKLLWVGEWSELAICAYHEHMLIATTFESTLFSDNVHTIADKVKLSISCTPVKSWVASVNYVFGYTKKKIPVLPPPDFPPGQRLFSATKGFLSQSLTELMKRKP